jgi:ABC-type antimicrobial peptide transport system permease subunit
LIHTGSAATGVVIVNQALADKFFGGAAAAPGRRLRIRGGGIQGQWLTVIGVVGNVRHDSLVTAPVPEIYTTISDTSINAMMVAVRTGGEPLSLVPAVRSAIWSIDRHTPISDVQTLSARVGASLARPRLLGVVLGGLASVGLLLVVLGVYGVVAYSVAQRTREIGIMIALGAERGRVVGSVLSEGLRFAVLGTAVGVPAALAATRLLRTVLYGVTPADPATYVALVAFTIALVSAACSVPAWRAARVDPLVSIRTE